MAGSRSAASLSLTIGIAFATLVVATGILAGPAVLDCSQSPSSFGACLRGKVVESGLLPPEAAPITSAEPTPRALGWIEANATEFEAPMPDVVQLRAEPGKLHADGALPSVPEISAEVALVEPSVELRADGFAPFTRQSGDASLAPAITGSIDASGDAGLPRNGLSATTSIGPPAVPAPPAVSGQVGPTARGQGRASLAPQLIADLSPVPPLRQIVPAAAPKAPPQIMPPSLPAPEATAQVQPKPAAPLRPPKYDPRYPSVLVLPPPNTGENSSFATLTLH